ncbi:MAG: 2-succinyl-5-enolpyruvyl-6-hydroxy-3-cyclohexene-1-carboxylic-acid synthase, partial [Gemmatimonadales bacterium]
MKARSRNELWAGVLVDELIRCGLREVVVSPGSRSTPLVLAAASRPELRIVVRIDERSAAFFALGVGKATGRPAAVITTSGTAVANLFPAVVEADRAGVPLLLLTADRPPRLREADANQAIDQTRIFGRYPRLFQELSPAELSDRTLRHLRSVMCQAVAASAGVRGGPVHLNLAFEKPLEPTPEEGDPVEGVLAVGGVGVRGRPDGAPFTRIHGERTLVPASLAGELRRRLTEARR